jgi:hypothetical protein
MSPVSASSVSSVNLNNRACDAQHVRYPPPPASHVPMEILRLEIDQICLGHHTRETPRHFRELFEATLSAFLLWRTATSMPYSFAFNGKRRTRNALAAADCQRATYRDRSRYHARPYCWHDIFWATKSQLMSCSMKAFTKSAGDSDSRGSRHVPTHRKSAAKCHAWQAG